ncbi:MAG: shikimate dehydrogenase [Chitinophagia bacterium]
MRKFGLIGYPLTHSFSEGYFANKFAQENIADAQYVNFPIDSIQKFLALWEDPLLAGLNITIPYKKEVLVYLNEMSEVVQQMQACNCIKKQNGKLIGYNTDVIGFEKSLQPFLKPHHQNALILGTGGAAAAVEYVLSQLGIHYVFVSRNNTPQTSQPTFSYEDLNASIMSKHTLIINTSPVGMFPNTQEAPSIPYELLTTQHHLYDLVYNPAETLFMAKGLAKGASVQNGLDMLHIQAEESWKIWNTTQP